MSIERARAHLRKWNLEDRIQEFAVSSATVELAAAALNVEPARIAKTLSYMVDGSPVLVVAAGDIRVNNRKFKDAFHTKAKMLSPDRAEELTGHRVGGVCPFGVNPDTAKVCLDASLRRFDVVYPAAGTDNTAVRLTLDELEHATGGEWVDVCKSAQA